MIVALVLPSAKLQGWGGLHGMTVVGPAICRNGHSGVVEAIIEAHPTTVKYSDPTGGYNPFHYAVGLPCLEESHQGSFRVVSLESGKVAATIVRMLLASKCQLRNSVE